MGNIVLLIKKSFKIICKKQGHVKCGRFLMEEHFRANDDETDSSWGISESCSGGLKVHLISTCGSVKNKIKAPIYGLRPGNFQWQKAFMYSGNPAILNKLINNKGEFY